EVRMDGQRLIDQLVEIYLGLTKSKIITVVSKVIKAEENDPPLKVQSVCGLHRHATRSRMFARACAGCKRALFYAGSAGFLFLFGYVFVASRTGARHDRQGHRADGR